MSKDAPMYIFDLPQMKRDKDVEFFKDEVYRYIDRIEELTGNKLTPESLHDAIVLINNKRRAMQRLWEFRKLDNVPISGKDCLLISQIAFYDDPTRFAQKLMNCATNWIREKNKTLVCTKRRYKINVNRNSIVHSKLEITPHHRIKWSSSCM